MAFEHLPPPDPAKVALKNKLRAQGYCTIAQYEELKGKPVPPGRDQTNVSTVQGIIYMVEIVPDHPKRGAAPNPDSEAQRCPWLEEGISQATWYRRKAEAQKWSLIFSALGALDTPLNRSTYKELAKQARVLGVEVKDLWLAHLASLNPQKPSQVIASDGALSLSQSPSKTIPLHHHHHDNDEGEVDSSKPLSYTMIRADEHTHPLAAPLPLEEDDYTEGVAVGPGILRRVPRASGGE